MNATTLTNGQKKAAEKFFDFMLSDRKTFSISGTAGTGKTFLMGYLSDKVMKEYEQACAMIDVKPEFDSVAFTATTNKAAEVLSASLNQEVQTIHSFLGLIVKENYRTGKTHLERGKQWKVRRRLIVFIDECSMIDRALYAEILAALPDCKIVFVGDHAQMAPVNERISQLYEDLAEDDLVTLTEPVRNAGQPALVALCQQLRDTVETGIFNPIEEVDGVIDYLTDEDMEAGLHHYFQDLNPSCRVLCFTNTRVQEYNSFIREDVRHLGDKPQVGEVMVVGNPYANGSFRLSAEAEVEITDFITEGTSTDYLHSSGMAIDFWEVEVTPLGGGGFYIVRIPKSHHKFNLAVKNLAKQKLWAEYFDLKNSFVDLRDKASCTVYKSQGSTYDAVFVDLGNIGTSFDAEQVARMLFVAASRARNRVFLYGNLPPRYHNSQGKPLWTTASSSMNSSPSSPAQP